MTDSWDEVLENPSAPPETGHAVHPSHDAGTAGDGQRGRKTHMMLRRFCLTFCRAEPAVGRWGGT